MKGWAIGEGRGKGDCQRARSSGDEKALLGARALFQRFTMASAVLSVSATAAQARPSAARRAVQAKAAGRCGRGSRIGLRHPSCMLGLARVGPRPLPAPCPPLAATHAPGRCRCRPAPAPPKQQPVDAAAPRPHLAARRGVLRPPGAGGGGVRGPGPAAAKPAGGGALPAGHLAAVHAGAARDGGCWGAAGGEQRAGVGAQRPAARLTVSAALSRAWLQPAGSPAKAARNAAHGRSAAGQHKAQPAAGRAVAGHYRCCAEGRRRRPPPANRRAPLPRAPSVCARSG